MTIQTEAIIEQYFPFVLFIMLYKVVLPFESVDEILKCDRFKLTKTFLSKNSTLLSSGAVYYTVEGDSKHSVLCPILQNGIWDFCLELLDTWTTH